MSGAERTPALTITDYQGQVIRPRIAVYLPHNLTVEEFWRLLPSSTSDRPAFTFSALHNWLSKLQKALKLQEDGQHPFHMHPYNLLEIDVQAVDWFWRNRKGCEDKLGFMKIQAKIETDPYEHDNKDVKPDWIPGAVFLRGGSVAILIIVQPADASGDEEKYVLFCVQPRIPAGSLAFTEIPAGMLDGNSFKGTAASEIAEETSLTVEENDLINMSALALEDDTPGPSAEDLQTAIYPSVGACDEFIPLFLCQKRLSRRHMEWLKGKATGLRDEGETISVKLVPLSRAWREGARDAKALAALALYDNLKREGRLPEMLTEVVDEPAELK